jgi:hypothetical protein
MVTAAGATYLRHARVLLLPSFVEGYGLPMIEALSLGVPVIASNLPVFHEVAADIPDYLDPIDSTRWMNCVESFCNPASGLRTRPTCQDDGVHSTCVVGALLIVRKTGGTSVLTHRSSTLMQAPGHMLARLPGRAILVPGQVQTDAGRRCGAAEIRTNLGLVRAVLRMMVGRA